MLRSMTGYGAAEAEAGDAGRLSVDVRSVNHRYLDLRLKLPPSLQEHAGAVEALARKRLGRGRVELSVRAEGALAGAVHLDLERARSAFRQLERLRDELAPDAPVPLSLLGTVPDLFQKPSGADGAPIREALKQATRAALAALEDMRRREGAALRSDLEAHLDGLEARVAQIAEALPELGKAHRARLRERLERLLAERELPLDSGRLEHEVAVFLEKSDVSEELARLGSHAAQFRDLMASEAPAHGRRLDFLLQEMAREVNTLGAKTPSAEITRVVVELKADVERLREQVQNVL